MRFIKYLFLAVVALVLVLLALVLDSSGDGVQPSCGHFMKREAAKHVTK